MLIILCSVGIWSKLERWKGLISGCLLSWPQIKTIIVLKYSLLLSYETTKNHLSIGLWWVTKSGFYMTTSDNKFSGWAKKKLQSTYQSQKLPDLWWSTAGLVHSSFLNPGGTTTSEKHAQQVSEVTESCKACSRTGQQKGPGSSLQQRLATGHTTNTPNVERIVLRSFASSTIITWTLANHSFKHLNNLSQAKCFHNQQDAENAFREFIKFWGMDFYAVEISTFISHCQKCVEFTGSCFD